MIFNFTIRVFREIIFIKLFVKLISKINLMIINLSSLNNLYIKIEIITEIFMLVLKNV